jgi:flagellin-like protein
MMQLKLFRRNKKGISTIIASALIVAMTVIAAVALGSTVLQISGQTQSIPQLTMSGTASISDNEIRLTHTGGDVISTGSITFKTYIPDGKFKDYRYEIPNVISSNYENYGYSIMHLSTDNPEKQTWGPYTYYTYNTEYATYGSTQYVAPMQAGDTLVIDFDKSFGTATGQLYDWEDQLMAPKAGEQLIVELCSENQVICTIPITVQP